MTRETFGEIYSAYNIGDVFICNKANSRSINTIREILEDSVGRVLYRFCGQETAVAESALVGMYSVYSLVVKTDGHPYDPRFE